MTSERASDASSEAPSGPPPGAPTVCLGEVLVEFICERPLDHVADGDAFVPHLGGAAANVAVTAARRGAHVALAGGAGDDAWGGWLHDRLAREGIQLSLFARLAGTATPISIVAVSTHGEPTDHVYGEALGNVVRAVGDQLENAMPGAAGLFFSSGTLVGTEERDVTMRARQVALDLGRPIVFEANLRLARWRSRADAAAACNACVPGALLVRAGAEEAAVMTGEDDPERAALALVKAGARMVVITLGGAGLNCEGAILRGEMRMDVPGRSPAVRSTIGAGNVLTGVLLARLAGSGFYPPAVAASLPEAVEQAALACERWGALE